MRRPFITIVYSALLALAGCAHAGHDAESKNPLSWVESVESDARVISVETVDSGERAALMVVVEE